MAAQPLAQAATSTKLEKMAKRPGLPLVLNEEARTRADQTWTKRRIGL